MSIQARSYLYLSFGAFATVTIIGFTIGIKMIKNLDQKIRLLDVGDRRVGFEELLEIKNSDVPFGVFSQRLEEVRESLQHEILKLLKRGEHQFNTLTSRMDALESRLDSVENRLDSLESRLDSLESSVKKNGEDIRSVQTSLAGYFAQQEILIKALTEGMVKAAREASPI